MKKILVTTACVIVLCFVLSACAKGPGPQKKPEGAPEKEPVINLYVADKGSKEKINMEDYIAGVVAGEMETDWPVNALAAQAIIARTFTMKNIKEGEKPRGADASTDHEEFQAYEPSKINENVKKAVEKTRGEVITYEGEYAGGWFSACCGGITAAASEGLSGKKVPTGALREKAKDDCLSITTDENKHWKAEVPLSQVQEISGAGDVSSADISQKGPSGRAIDIKVGDKIIKAGELRMAVGPEKMRSTLLSSIGVEGDNLVVEGRGFGHGLGMCQWGAKKMAGEGKSPEDILKFYYKNVSIQKLWD